MAYVILSFLVLFLGPLRSFITAQKKWKRGLKSPPRLFLNRVADYIVKGVYHPYTLPVKFWLSCSGFLFWPSRSGCPTFELPFLQPEPTTPGGASTIPWASTTPAWAFLTPGHRWALFLQQQTSITVYRFLTKENKLLFLQKTNESLPFPFSVYIHIYWNGSIYIYRYMYIYTKFGKSI